MSVVITLIVAVLIFTGMYFYLIYEDKQSKITNIKDEKILFITRRASLNYNQKLVFKDGLLLIDKSKQIIQIAELYPNNKILLINRNNPKKHIKIKLKNLSIQNLQNIRDWISNDLYTKLT